MMPDVATIQPSRKAVEARLAKAQQRLTRFPRSWGGLEQIGRCLRWLDDPEAEAYFRQAAAATPVKEDHAGDLMRLGAIYRLAGEAEAAREQFGRARAILAPRAFREDPDPLDIEHMIPASFLVGLDDEVAALIARLRAIDPDTDLLCYPIARLAEARRARDADLAAEAVAAFVATVRRYGAHVWDTGGVLPWDWVEIAMEVWRSLV